MLVFVCVSVHLCVRNPILQCNFVICGSVVTKLDMEVTAYDAGILETYH